MTDCMESKSHDNRYEWSVTEGVDLAYDVGNPNCYARINVKWLGY